jgi:hypothetical protein
MDSLLLVAIIAGLIFIMLIPADVWKTFFWLAAVAGSGLVAFYAFLLWVLSL